MAEDGTKRIGLEPILQHLSGVSEKQNKIEEALGEIGFDLREVKGDLKWMRAEAAEVKTTARECDRSLTILETTIKGLNGPQDIQRLTDRVGTLEGRLTSLEAAGDAEEKAAARSTNWVQWVGAGVIAVLAATIPVACDRIMKEPPEKKSSKDKE